MGRNFCGTKNLAVDLAKNCTDAVVEGVEKISYILNRADIDIEATKASFVTGSKGLYASLVRNEGAKAYKVDNTANLVSTKVDGTYANRVQHVVSGVLLDDGDVPGSVIDALASKDGEFVMVVEHKFKDLNRATNPGSSAFQIIGLDSPLSSTGQEIKNDKASADTLGGWAFALASTEPNARNYWFAASYSATKALFDALGTPAV